MPMVMLHAVSDFLSFFKNLNFTRVVEESPKDLTPFGLNTPDLQIILSMDNGETKGVRVGDDHPMGNKVYLARLNERSGSHCRYYQKPFG